MAFCEMAILSSLPCSTHRLAEKSRYLSFWSVYGNYSWESRRITQIVLIETFDRNTHKPHLASDCSRAPHRWYCDAWIGNHGPHSLSFWLGTVAGSSASHTARNRAYPEPSTCP